MSTEEEDEELFLDKLSDLKVLVDKIFGFKCKEYYPACVCCVAWKCIEDLEELIRST